MNDRKREKLAELEEMARDQDARAGEREERTLEELAALLEMAVEQEADRLSAPVVAQLQLLEKRLRSSQPRRWHSASICSRWPTRLNPLRACSSVDTRMYPMTRRTVTVPFRVETGGGLSSYRRCNPYFQRSQSRQRSTTLPSFPGREPQSRAS
jgi:hypothetical protein